MMDLRPHSNVVNCILLLPLVGLWLYISAPGVVRAQTLISERDIQRAVEDFVFTSLGLPKENLQIECGPHRAIRVKDDGKVRVVVSKATKGELRGTVPLKIEIWADGALQRRSLATARIRLFDRVVVASQRIDRHEALTPQKLKVERRDVTDLTGGYFTAVGMLKGKRAKVLIPFNRVVTKRCVERVPVVTRGSEVTILAQAGNVFASAKGLALEDGGVGDKIRVRNGSSKVSLVAKVIDATTVKVIF